MFRHNINIKGGVELQSYSTKDNQNILVCQFRYNIGGEMHFYQENTGKKSFETPLFTAKSSI